MAKGDYILFNNVSFQSVLSHPRRYGVMFNPSSSRSRLRIRDSGRRYGVRLNDGVVEISIDGDVNWKQIDPLTDPCTGQQFPKILSFENLRTGEALDGIVFDMIAVGRGRIIAKEAGTDRLFHLYIDEMFRTFHRDCNPNETNPPPLDEDPPIPPFNMKIDPEYFTDAPPTVVVPPEATRNYSSHPASLRLPVFNQLLELDVADVMLMMERARTFYFKDIRSQLAITTQDDLAFTEDDLKAVFTQPVIKDILESIKSAAIEMQESNLLAKLLIEAGFQPDPIATDWRRQLEEDGLMALVFPAYAALGVLLYGAHASKGVKRDPFTGQIRINLPAIMNFMSQPMPNPTAQRYVNEAMAKFNEALAELMLRSRRGVLQRYGDRPDVRRKELPDEWTIENKLPTPNQPPSWMPTVIRTTYMRSMNTGQGTWRQFYHDETITKVWIGTNADGRLEAFGLGSNNTVWHTRQAVASGDWDGSWQLLHTDQSADQRTQLTVARNSDGRLELFGLSSDKRIWHTLQTAPNDVWDDGWQELYSSNDKLKTITVAQNADGRLQLLGVGTDDRVWHTFQTAPNGNWVGNWQPIAAGKMSNVWVGINVDGRLEAFAVSSDDKVWNMAQVTPGGNWAGTWAPFYGDDKVRSLAVGRNLNGQLEVVGVGPDQRVWRTWQTAKNGPWLGHWEELYQNGQHLTDVWLVSHLDGRLEAFGLQEAFPHLNDTVWHTWQMNPNGDWNGSWVQISADGGRQDLAVALNTDGRVEMIGIKPGLFATQAWNIRLVRVKPSWHGVWKKFFTDNDNLHKVWLDRNVDGRLEAFGLDKNKTILNTSQDAPNGGWSGPWTRLYSAQDTRVQLATGRNSDGRLELFSVTSDNRVFRTSQKFAGKEWNQTWVEVYKSTEKHTNLCVGTNADGRLELFGTSPNDNRVWHTWQTVAGDSTQWKGSWEELYQASDQRSALAVARNLDGRLQLFGIRSSDNTVWHTSQARANGDWDKTWIQLDGEGKKMKSIVAGRNQDGTLEVFGVAPDNSVWHTRQTEAGKNWSGRWDNLYSSKDKLNYLWLVTNNDGRLELFGIKSDLLFFWENRLFHTWQTRPNGNWSGAWVEIEADWGRRTIAAAPNVDGRIEIIGVQPPVVPNTSTEFPDDHVWNTRLLAEHRYAIQYSEVLDIGIGSSHWSENWQSHFGGEIHSLLQHRPLFQGEQYSLIQYRFLNGPVIDGDAFNDGTTNFYMMVKLGPPGATGAGYLQRYAILWFDEQTYFTTRLRLLHPTDDTLGDLFSLPTALRNNPEWFDFQLSRYWCPFRANLIDDDSRMIVRRNIIVVTGHDTAANRYEIYTIVFNYGLCDHSWRWRLFPPNAKQVVMDRDKAQDQDPQLPDEVTSSTSVDAYVVVNTIDLRDDTMLHVRGSLRIGGTLQLGRWVQRYPPADCQHVPERHELKGPKPVSGYSHPWDFISDPAFKRSDQFYQFGVYEGLVDSRAQYYEIDLLPDRNGVMPRVEDVVAHVWSNDSGGLRGDQLKHNTINFNWALPKENSVIVKRTSDPDNPLSPELFVHEFRKRGSMSMYEPTTRFRILERKPLGLIAVFYDKRDDELQAASDLPQPTTFVQNDDVETGIPDTWKTADGEMKPLLPPPQAPSIRVMVKSNHRVYMPPNVRKAWMQLDKAPGQRELHLSFWTPQMEDEVNENIWRVSLAAIDETGRVVPLFSVLRFGAFVRRAVPQGPVPLGFRDELGDEWRYDWTWKFNKDEEEVNARRFCTPAGHFQFGTSLWFEDIVGHRAIAEQTIFE